MGGESDDYRSCLYRTHEIQSRINIEIEDFGVAHVWFQWYEKGYFEKCSKHYLRR